MVLPCHHPSSSSFHPGATLIRPEMHDKVSKENLYHTLSVYRGVKGRFREVLRKGEEGQRRGASDGHDELSKLVSDFH